MAKLSARGRVELVRLERIEDPARPRYQGDDTAWRRDLFAVMSDGRILTRAEWKAPGYGMPREGDPAGYQGRKLETGWRVHGRLKVPVEEHRTRWIAAKLAQGFRVIGTPTIPIPEPARKVVAHPAPAWKVTP